MDALRAIVTKSPVAGRPTLRVRAATGYNELRAKSQADVGVTYGQRFGKVGVILAGSYLNSYRQEESLHYARGDDLLENLTLYNYQLDRDRYGASGTFEYDLDDRSRFFVRAMVNRFEDRQYTPKFSLQLAGGSELTSTGAAQAPTVRTGRKRDWEREIVTLSGGGEHDWGRVRADYRVSYARGGLTACTFLEALIGEHRFPLPRLLLAHQIPYPWSCGLRNVQPV